MEIFNKISVSGHSLIVKLADKYRRALPFGNLKSRVGIAYTLSYYGDSDDVLFMMQRVSHRTRSFIHNSDRLKGFLARGIIAILKQAD